MNFERQHTLLQEFKTRRLATEGRLIAQLQGENPILFQFIQDNPGLIAQSIGSVDADMYNASSLLTYDLLAQPYRDAQAPVPQIDGDTLLIHNLFLKSMVRMDDPSQAFFTTWVDYLEGEAPGIIAYLAQAAEVQTDIPQVSMSELILGAADVMYPFKLREMMEAVAKEYGVPVPTVAELFKKKRQ